jgi:hypothetical protein
VRESHEFAKRPGGCAVGKPRADLQDAEGNKVFEQAVRSGGPRGFGFDQRGAFITPVSFSRRDRRGCDGPSPHLINRMAGGPGCCLRRAKRIGSGATRRGTLPLPRKSVLQRVRPIVSPGGVKANRRDQGTFLSALRKWPGGYHDRLPSGKEADWQFALSLDKILSGSENQQLAKFP